MPVELKIPSVGESITEVVVGRWRKAVGETIERDEELVELETDKATVDLPAPESGVIVKILKDAGETAAVGEVIGYIDSVAAAKSAETQTPAPAAKEKKPEAQVPSKNADAAVPAKPAREKTVEKTPPKPADHGFTPSTVLSAGGMPGREEKAVPMTPIRKKIAERLVQAQQAAALLTTFNEIDMSVVIELRKKYRDMFQERYGVKLGFMSFFVKAVVEALSDFPQINAEIRGSDLVYRNYFDIGVAVGSSKGLVVPVLRNAEQLSFGEIEQSIADFGKRAEANKLKPEEMQGGTFTISNGGVYGSLLSTPIVNPPQSGVLGMHAIQERPVVREGQIVIRPMMYVALTYDHRVVDGKEAVSFLVRVRQIVEEPTRLLMEI